MVINLSWEVTVESEKLAGTRGTVYMARIEGETISELWEELDRFVVQWRAHRVTFSKEIKFFSHVFTPEFANGKWHLEVVCS